MASNFNPGHVTSPQLLQRVSGKVLLRFLWQYEEFLKKERVYPTSVHDIDYDKLSAVLASPSEQMPAQLLADLVYWDEVSQIVPDDDLSEEARKQDVTYSAKATKEEITLLLRMKAPQSVEYMHALYQAQSQLHRKKRFYSYSAQVRPLPTWKKPTRAMLDEFGKSMDMWYDGEKKGKGTRILPVYKPDATWFIVRHGGTFKKENALENGEPVMVFYRPEDYDILIYHHKRGELEIYNASNGKRERRAYCVYLGDSLFGDPEFFLSDDVARYSLEPLRERGAAALDCSEVEGVASARLTDLVYRFNGDNDHRVTHKAEDVFAGLDDLGLLIPREAELLSMRVKLTLDNELGGERSVKLRHPNVSIYDHESDAEIARRFLVEQEFIQSNGSAVRNN